MPLLEPSITENPRLKKMTVAKTSKFLEVFKVLSSEIVEDIKSLGFPQQAVDYVDEVRISLFFI